MPRKPLNARLAEPLRYARWMRNPERFSGSVYVIQCGDFVKVGIAKDVHTRLIELQVGNPLPLVLLRHWVSVDAVGEEETIHQALDAYRVRGEWFKVPPDALTWLLNRPPNHHR